MKITLLTYGNAEAVKPFAALASALKCGGYDAGLAVPAGSDADPAYSGTDRARMDDRVVWRRLVTMGDGSEEVRAGDGSGNLREICAESDLIISDLRLLDHVLPVSDELGGKLMAAALTPPCPLSRSAALVSGILRKLPFLYGAAGKREAGDAWPLTCEAAPSKPVPRDIPVLHAYSACFLESPGEQGGPTAGGIVTGEWRTAARDGEFILSSKSRKETGQWLDEGDAPLFFGFSGLPLQTQARCIQTALDAAKELSCRAVIEADWQALGRLGHELPGHALPVEQADYDRLFPRCRSVMHRGSSAAAHASLRAGIPALVCPAAEEERVWGRLTAAAGAGRCLPLNKVTRKKLTQALRGLEDRRVRNKTAELGACLRQENGIETAIPFIDRCLSWTQYRKF